MTDTVRPLRVVVLALDSTSSRAAFRAIHHLHDIVAVYSDPPPRTRGGSLAARLRMFALHISKRVVPDIVPSLRGLCAAHGIPFAEVHNVNDPAVVSSIVSLEADVMCVISLSRLLAAPILEATRLGALHAHASLLPDYKGPNPFFWMVKRNERMGGVSLHWMTSVPDAGEVVARRELPLFPGMTAREHDSALAILAAGAFYVALQGLATGELATTPNEATNTPFARNPRGEDLHLDGLPTVEHALWFHEVASAYGTPRLSVTGGPVTRVSRTHFVGSTEFQCRDGIMWGMPA